MHELVLVRLHAARSLLLSGVLKSSAPRDLWRLISTTWFRAPVDVLQVPLAQVVRVPRRTCAAWVVSATSGWLTAWAIRALEAGRACLSKRFSERDLLGGLESSLPRERNDSL